MEDISKDEFRIIGIDKSMGEIITSPKLGYWQDVGRRFKTNKIALFATLILVLIILMTIIGPLINNIPYDEFVSTKNLRPSSDHWFGTDELGRDIFARVCQGGRVSLAIGITGALIATIVGSIYGAIAAYVGGIVDTFMMRIVEILLSVPYLIMVILISIWTGSRSLSTMIITLTITGWCATARLVRGQVLQIKQEEYIMAAETLGVSTWKIIVKHLIPNTLGVILVAITFDIPGFIFAESFLSYIGLGIESPKTSWGALAAAAQQNLRFYPYQLFFPGIMIALVMLSFTLLGDGLRDALDPRLRQ